MNIQFFSQGTSGSPWMNEYMKGRLERLERYIPRDARIEVELGAGSVQLIIHTHKQRYTFSGKGSDLYESFSAVLEEALRILRSQHQKVVTKKFIRPETN